MICCIVWCQHDGSHSLCSLSLIRWWATGGTNQPGDLRGETELLPHHLDSTQWHHGPVSRHLLSGGRRTPQGGEMKLSPSCYFVTRDQRLLAPTIRINVIHTDFIYLWQPKYKNIHPLEDKQCIKMLHKTHLVFRVLDFRNVWTEPTEKHPKGAILSLADNQSQTTSEPFEGLSWCSFAPSVIFSIA